MRVIPVLDIKNGVVVRALRGDRDSYRPIETPLAPGTCEPLTIARALLGLCSKFPGLYVADLDAIVRRGTNWPIVSRLSQVWPGHEFLVDEGLNATTDVCGRVAKGGIVPVIGTECLSTSNQFAPIVGGAGHGQVALSLDWRDGVPMGPPSMYETNEHWPHTVIVMTLDRVGGRNGPDFARLSQVKARAGDRTVLAAGGVRDVNDLRRLRDLGCGALVATALHDGSISTADLDGLLG